MAPDPARPLLRPLAVWILAVPCMVPAILLGFLLAPLVGRRRAFWLLAPGWVRLAAAAFGLRGVVAEGSGANPVFELLGRRDAVVDRIELDAAEVFRVMNQELIGRGLRRGLATLPPG